MVEQIIIENYKSIKNLTLPLRSLNILIGSNGAGKSNFISFFELVKAIYDQRLSGFTIKKGGMESLLYGGKKKSDYIYGLLDFDNTNALFFRLKSVNSKNGEGYIDVLGDLYNNLREKDKKYLQWSMKEWDRGVKESNLRDEKVIYWARYVKQYINSFTVYHFNDSSEESKMRGSCKLNDNSFLREDGSNLAAYLYMIQNTDEKAFRLIEGTIKSVAPYFKRFNLKPNNLNSSEIALEWEEENSDMYLNGYSFSDGTLRFIALATLLLQPKLPEIIIIDEPELGLHPVAIAKLSSIIRMSSKKSQIIISTQSPNLVNHFNPDDIIVVDREDNQSVFKRLDEKKLNNWLKDYSLGELWEKNIIGGQI